MAQSKEFVDASHALDDLSHALALLESENASLRGVADGLRDENAKLCELVRHLYEYRQLYFKTGIYPTDHGVTEQRMRELGVEV